MKVVVYQDELGNVSLYERPGARPVEAELAEGYAVSSKDAGQPLIVKDGGKLDMSAQRALECGILQVPPLPRKTP
jgi:hypothetical protein